MEHKREQIIKLADVLLCAAVVALSFLCLLLRPGGADAVVVKQGGDVIYSGSLAADAVIEVEGAYHNVITIEQGAVRFSQSDCPNRDCVHASAIRSGSVACAPNEVIVIVTRESGVDAVAG